jgi:hypothetical protein
MELPQDARSAGFLKACGARRNMECAPAHPHLDTAGSRKVEAWFLGPKGENADILERLIVEAVRNQVYWRRNSMSWEVMLLWHRQVGY